MNIEKRLIAKKTSKESRMMDLERESVLGRQRDREDERRECVRETEGQGG